MGTPARGASPRAARSEKLIKHAQPVDLIRVDALCRRANWSSRDRSEATVIANTLRVHQNVCLRQIAAAQDAAIEHLVRTGAVSDEEIDAADHQPRLTVCPWKTI